MRNNYDPVEAYLAVRGAALEQPAAHVREVAAWRALEYNVDTVEASQGSLSIILIQRRLVKGPGESF